MKKVFILLCSFISLQLAAQNVGIGTTTPRQKLDVAGTATIRDSLGLGVPVPNAPLQFANTSGNRKLVLYEDQNNDHLFYGFGINESALRYQSGGNHVFYSGVSANSSREVFRINANGLIGVGISAPVSRLSNTSLNTIAPNGIGVNFNSFSWQMNTQGYTQALYNASTDGLANGLAVKIAGTTSSNRLLDLSVGAVQDAPGTSVMVVQGDGKVGVGTGNPQQKLEVNGNIGASGNFMIGMQYISQEGTMPANSISQVFCNCPPGTKVTGGGGGHRDYNISQSDVTVNFSGPSSDGLGWRAYFTNKATSSRTVAVWALCARVQ